MKIKIQCPECLKSYSVDPDIRGKKVKCKVCEASFLVGNMEADEAKSYQLAAIIPPGPPPVDPKSSPRLTKPIIQGAIREANSVSNFCRIVYWKIQLVFPSMAA